MSSRPRAARRTPAARDDLDSPRDPARALQGATEEHPALVIGTSSAWPSSEVDGNALTLTAAQMLGSQFSGSIGLAYILDNSDWKVPGSLRYGLGGGYEATMIYDGDAVHPLITWRNDAFSFSFIMLGAEDPTISVTVGF